MYIINTIDIEIGFGYTSQLRPKMDVLPLKHWLPLLWISFPFLAAGFARDVCHWVHARWRSGTLLHGSSVGLYWDVKTMVSYSHHQRFDCLLLIAVFCCAILTLSIPQLDLILGYSVQESIYTASESTGNKIRGLKDTSFLNVIPK